jgi:hypothetical protein
LAPGKNLHAVHEGDGVRIAGLVSRFIQPDAVLRTSGYADRFVREGKEKPKDSRILIGQPKMRRTAIPETNPRASQPQSRLRNHSPTVPTFPALLFHESLSLFNRLCGD